MINIKNNIYKFITVLLAVSVLLLSFSFNEIKARAEVATLTAAGAAALITLLAVAGVDFSNVMENGSSDASTDTSEENEPAFLSADYIQQMAVNMTFEQIIALNEMGENVDATGMLTIHRDGMDIMADWIANTFMDNITAVPIECGNGSLNAIYNYLSTYTCDCNKENLYNYFSSGISKSSYLNNYYHIIRGYSNIHNCDSIYLGFTSTSSHGIYTYKDYAFFSGYLSGWDFPLNECSCGNFSISSNCGSGAFQYSALGYDYTVLATGEYTGLGEISDSLFDEKSVFSAGDAYFDIASDSLAGYITNNLDKEVDEVVPGVQTWFNDVLTDFSSDVATETGETVALSAVKTSAVTLEETEDGYNIYLPQNVGVLSPALDTVLGSDIVDYDKPAQEIEVPADVLTGIQNIWNWISTFFTNIYKTLCDGFDYLFNKIRDFFMPNPDDFNICIENITNEFKRIFGFDDFDFSIPFGEEKELDDVSGTVPYGEYKYTGIIIDFSFLRDAVDFMRPYIRGFLMFLLVIYNINQFLALIGQRDLTIGTGLISKHIRSGLDKKDDD